MEDREKILKFISRFHGSEYVFLHGCCYWFAWMLDYRFYLEYETRIMYEPIGGHFITKIGNHFYDVRGDVTELYRGKPMYDMDELQEKDSKHYSRLMRDCRDFEEAKEDG